MRRPSHLPTKFAVLLIIRSLRSFPFSTGLFVCAQYETVLVDDTNSSISYVPVGYWDHFTGGPDVDGPYENTTTFTNLGGAVFSYVFTGIGISVYGTLESSAIDLPATSQYSVDGVVQWTYTPADYNSTYRFDRVCFYESQALSNQEHTLVVTNLNNHTDFRFDYLNVTVLASNGSGSSSGSRTSTSLGTSLSSSSWSSVPTNSTAAHDSSSSALTRSAVAGIVVGSTLGVALCILAILLWRQNGRSQGLTPLKSREDTRTFDLADELPRTPHSQSTFYHPTASSHHDQGGDAERGKIPYYEPEPPPLPSPRTPTRTTYPPSPQHAPPPSPRLVPNRHPYAYAEPVPPPSSPTVPRLEPNRHPYAAEPEASTDSRLSLFGFNRASSSVALPIPIPPPVSTSTDYTHTTTATVGARASVDTAVRAGAPLAQSIGEPSRAAPGYKLDLLDDPEGERTQAQNQDRDADQEASPVSPASVPGSGEGSGSGVTGRFTGKTGLTVPRSRAASPGDALEMATTTSDVSSFFYVPASARKKQFERRHSVASVSESLYSEQTNGQHDRPSVPKRQLALRLVDDAPGENEV